MNLEKFRWMKSTAEKCNAIFFLFFRGFCSTVDTWHRPLLPDVVDVHAGVVEGLELGVDRVHLGGAGPEHPVAAAAAAIDVMAAAVTGDSFD